MRFKIWHIILLAFILRLLLNIPVLNDETLALHNDSYLHLKIAENLVHSNGFSNCSSKPFYKNTIITPGYPYFLAGIRSIFSKDLRFIVGIQIVMDVIICGLIFLLGKVLYDRKTGIIASLLYALSSHAITYSGLVITETLFTLILFFTLYQGLKNSKKYDFVILAILYGLLVMIRPIALYLLPVFGFMAMKSNSLKEVLRAAVTIIIGGLLVFSWMNRNHKLTGLYTVSSIKEYNLYFTFANAIEAKTNSRNENLQRDILLRKMDNQPLEECSGNYNYVIESKTKGLEILRSNILPYILLHVKSVPNMFLPEITLLSEKWGLGSGDKGTLAVINKEGFWAGFKHYYRKTKKGFIIMMPFILIWLVTLVSFVLGVLKMNRKLGKGITLILFVVFYFTIIPGPAGNGRFLMPVIPLICLVAASGIRNKD